MCWIFGHKVIKAELFRPVKFKSDGVLGKVTHSYNKKNFWHTLGNFFIGAGPIIFGIIVLALLLWLFLPETGRTLMSSVNSGISDVSDNGINFVALFKLFFTGTGDFIIALFSIKNILTFRFWLFIFLAACIVMHMSLSSADLKGCGKGVVSIIIIALIISVILTVFKLPLSMAFLISYNVYIVSFLTMGIILSAFVFLIMLIPYYIKKRILRNRIRKKYAQNIKR